MTVTQADTPDVPWQRCRRRDCSGVAAGDGTCLAHMKRAELSAALAAIGRGRPLDARGVHIDAALLQRVLQAAPKDGEGRPVLNRARFERATFAGDTLLDGVVFEKEVSFDRTRFDGDASFRGSRFAGNARFARTSFTGTACFEMASFDGQAWFGGATFAGPAIFDGGQFANMAWFARSQFETDAQFKAATFAGDTTFDGAAFGCHVIFVGTSFKGQAELERAKYNHDANFQGATFTGKGGAPQAAVRQAIWSGAALAPWRSRAGAALIDYGLPAAMIVGGGALGAAVEALSYQGAVVVGLVAGFLAGAVFTVRNLTEQGHTGQTKGKRRFGTCLVLERNGEPVGPKLSLLRQLLHGLDGLAAGVGWLRPLWHPKRQTFADSILTTVVVKRQGWARVGSSDAPTAEGPPPGGG